MVDTLTYHIIVIQLVPTIPITLILHSVLNSRSTLTLTHPTMSTSL